MAFTRQLFEVPLHAITTLYADTGPPVTGYLHQVRWNPSVGDTGVILQIVQMPKAGDTGDGITVMTINGVNQKMGGTGFFDCPRQPATYGVTDNSGDSGFQKFAFCQDRVQIKITNDTGTNNLSGRLYLWFTDN